MTIAARQFLSLTSGLRHLNLRAAIAGWITDLSSSRQAPFLASLALAFTATLLFCFGRAPWVLIAARAFQGVAGSIIYTAGLALIADSVRSDEVGSWYSSDAQRQRLRIVPDSK